MMKTEYKIMGCYQGNTEEIDFADTSQEAHYLKGEYQSAFGSNWSIWVEKVRYKADDCV